MAQVAVLQMNIEMPQVITWSLVFIIMLKMMKMLLKMMMMLKMMAMLKMTDVVHHKHGELRRLQVSILILIVLLLLS